MTLQNTIEYLTSHKDSKVREGGELLKSVFENPLLETFVTIKETISNWNAEIKEKKPSIFVEAIAVGDKIAYVDNFKNVSDYLGDISKLVKSMEEIKKHLLPHELIAAEEHKPKSMEEIMLRGK
jgi:hypothetical protein